MKTIFIYPGNEKLGLYVCKKLGFTEGKVVFRHFPDRESYVQIESEIKGQEVYILCTLDRPDDKAMALMFFAQIARDIGAKKVGLLAPYLGYMRQDKVFHEGEGITSQYFAEFISQHFDSLITIDPHLHRHKSLDEIYKIPATLLHADSAIADWIKNNIKNPLLIGPDEESKQWVEKIADLAEADFIVLKKTRSGDRQVKISTPNLEPYKDHNLVILDDIISTAKTMIKAIEVIDEQTSSSITCMGIHAVFADNSYEELKASGVGDIITCNTIAHPSNQIDISSLLVSSLTQ